MWEILTLYRYTAIMGLMQKFLIEALYLYYAGG